PPTATATNPYAKQDGFTRSAANTTAKPAPTPQTTTSNPYAAKPAAPVAPAPAPAAPATTTSNPYGPKPTPTTPTTIPPYTPPKPATPVAPIVPAPQSQSTPFWPFATPMVPAGYRDSFTLPHNTAPSEIADAFKAAANRVPVLLGRSGLSPDQIGEVRLDLARQAVNQLVNANGTIVDKVAALNDIGDVGVLSSSQKLTVQDELVRREVERIRHAQDSFDEKHARLTHMEPFMTASTEQAALHLLIDDEAHRIAAGHDSPKAREERLDKLRVKVGMSTFDFESYKGLISLKH
ncbi:MAG: hypothetical protein JWM80_6118, partial [Cyanobacteria bacterium RYN_339]|nr:hypothetical protein [Cyanobacteria bacterium RYN_339]